MKVIRGGFEVSAEDRRLVNVQRAITKAINEKFVQVGATYLKPASKYPVDDDWFKRLRGDTDLQLWVDGEDHQQLNVGFNLQLGWMDVDIDAEDPEYNHYIISAMECLGVDTRFRFGRASVGCPTHLFVQLAEDESANYDDLRKFEPREFRLGDKRYHTQLRSFPTNIDARNLVKSAKQTVVPGSLYVRKTTGGPGDADYDCSVWYAGSGGVAANVSDIAATTPRRANFTQVVRAVAFGTIAYLLRNVWVEGGRQRTAVQFTGWLARVVKDSAAMNEHETISADVFCPVDTDSWAEKLIHFVCDSFNDDEKHMRTRAYFDAREKLDRNPDAKVPGWHAMAAMLGAESMHALRTVLMPGNDVSKLTVMADRYIYDETDNKYIDRERHSTYGVYTHDGNELERRHKGDIVFVAGKPREAFRVFESSNMRKRVGYRDMFPDLDPGAIYRIDVAGRPVSDDSEDLAMVVFNTWKGWPVKPVARVDDAVMAKCVKYMDQLFAYIARDNKDQIEWLKDWIAWTFQHPSIKQQIAPVIVGGQGVGKSFFGNTFMRALLTDKLWGSASPKVLEGAFSIAPFKDKMFVFIDEAKFHGEAGTDEIKKLIRNVHTPGQEKFIDARDYKIYSRICFASNRFDMNIGQRDVRDRALFYMRSYDKDYLGMTEMEFRAWTVTLKPWFVEFDEFLIEPGVPEHYVRFFMDRQVNKYQIESIEFSSTNDPEIVAANMTWTRRIAKAIIESGWIAAEDLSIEYPFDKGQFNERVAAECKNQGMPAVQGQKVWDEMSGMGLTGGLRDSTGNLLRVKHKYGDLLRVFSEATGLVMEPYRDPGPDDYGINECTKADRIKRVGTRPNIAGKF